MGRLKRRDRIQGVEVASFPAIGKRVCKLLSESAKEADARYVLCRATPENRYSVATDEAKILLGGPQFMRSYESLIAFHHNLDVWKQGVPKSRLQMIQAIAKEWFRLSTSDQISNRDAIADRIDLEGEKLEEVHYFAGPKIQGWVDDYIQDLRNTTEVRSPLTLLLVPIAIRRTLLGRVWSVVDDLTDAVRSQVPATIENHIAENPFLQLVSTRGDGYSTYPDPSSYSITLAGQDPDNIYYTKNRSTTYKVGQTFVITNREAFNQNRSAIEFYSHQLSNHVKWAINDTIWRQCLSYAKPMPERAAWASLQLERSTLLISEVPPAWPAEWDRTMRWDKLDRAHHIQLQHGEQSPACFLLDHPIRIDLDTTVLRDNAAAASSHLHFKCVAEITLTLPTVWRVL